MKLRPLVSFALAVLLFGSPALANDTAINDGASGPEPVGWRAGAESIIQMKNEHISVHFGQESSRVTAKFTFVSHKSSGPATQKLGFPDMSRSDTEGDVIGPIENLKTYVDGKLVESELVVGYFRETFRDDAAFYERAEKPAEEDAFGPVRRFAWHIIEATFPPGEEVVVERHYEAPTGKNTTFESLFVYETRTGGAWRGEIERLTADVTFEPGIDPGLVILQPRDGWVWDPDRTRATLTWTNFEPRTDRERQYFEVITPDVETITKLHKEHPEDFLPLDKWVENWKKMYEERERG